MSRSDGYFPKGVSGNPKGRPKIKKETRDALAGNRDQVVAEFTRLFKMPWSELVALAENEEQAGITFLCARLMFQAANKADPTRAALVFEQSALSMPKRMEMTGDEGEAISHTIECVVTDYRQPEPK